MCYLLRDHTTLKDLQTDTLVVAFDGPCGHLQFYTHINRYIHGIQTVYASPDAFVPGQYALISQKLVLMKTRELWQYEILFKREPVFLLKIRASVRQ